MSVLGGNPPVPGTGPINKATSKIVFADGTSRTLSDILGLETISSGAYDGSGHLVFTLSDGTTLPPIVAPSGGVNSALPGNLAIVGDALVGYVQPSIQWTTQPTFDPTHKAFGSSAIVGGVGSYPFVIPAVAQGADTKTNYGFSFYSSVSSFTGAGDFVQIVASDGIVFGLRRTGTTLSANHNGTIIDTGFVVGDDQLHRIQVTLVGAANGKNYAAASLDGNSAGGQVSIDNNSLNPLSAGNAVFKLDNTNLAAGDALDEFLLSINDADATAAVPTAEFVAAAGRILLFHFNDDGANAASPPVQITFSSGVATATTPGTIIPGAGTAIAPDGTLSIPNIAPVKMYFPIKSDGSSNTGELNAFTLDASNHGVGQVLIPPGMINAYSGTPALGRTNLAIIGLGPRTSDSYGDAGGGVMIQTQLNSPTGCFDMVGAKNDPATASGFIFRSVLENIALRGETQSFHATDAGGPARLMRKKNTYECKVFGVSFSGDFVGGLYEENDWDGYIDLLKFNTVGFADPHANPSDAAVISYTGRQPIALETQLGRSFGVPMWEIVSPNTNGGGQDTSNNIRRTRCHMEGNSENAVGIILRGGNANMHQFWGLKIELAQGNSPLFVAEKASGLTVKDSWFLGSGNGYPFGSFGNVANGEIWGTMTNPGLILLGDCLSPTFDVTMGYTAGHSPLQAYIRCIGTEDPRLLVGCSDGITMLTPTDAAWMSYEDCGPISAARNHFYPQKYIQSEGGANLTPYKLIGNSTMVA